MTDEQLRPAYTNSRRAPWWALALGVGLLAVGGFSVYQNSEIAEMKKQLADQSAALERSKTALRAIFTKSDSDVSQAISDMRRELAATRQEATSGVQQVQTTVAKQAGAIAGRLEAKQKEQAQEFNAELAKVKESHEDTTNRLSNISTEVGSVKSEVETTKTRFERALSDLQRVRGDMGVMSGLIATNSKEIQLLRELGDRNIYEFTLSKKAGLQQIGDVRLALKKTDLKKNKFTLDLLSGDKRVEKKDKSLNEPVQFYVASKSMQPYELVVNEVKKDQVVGYLATPKQATTQADRGKGTDR